MASVRGVLNIQSLIELSSLVREFILYVDVHRTGLRTRARISDTRRSLYVDTSLAAWDFVERLP
jgi:hypothetical protein